MQDDDVKDWEEYGTFLRLKAGICSTARRIPRQRGRCGRPLIFLKVSDPAANLAGPPV